MIVEGLGGSTWLMVQTINKMPIYKEYLNQISSLTLSTPGLVSKKNPLMMWLQLQQDKCMIKCTQTTCGRWIKHMILIPVKVFLYCHRSPHVLCKKSDSGYLAEFVVLPFKRFMKTSWNVSASRPHRHNQPHQYSIIKLPLCFASTLHN